MLRHNTDTMSSTRQQCKDQRQQKKTKLNQKLKVGLSMFKASLGNSDHRQNEMGPDAHP